VGVGESGRILPLHTGCRFVPKVSLGIVRWRVDFVLRAGFGGSKQELDDLRIESLS